MLYKKSGYSPINPVISCGYESDFTTFFFGKREAEAACYLNGIQDVTINLI